MRISPYQGVPLADDHLTRYSPEGVPLEVMALGQHEMYSLTGEFNLVTGKRIHGLGARKPNALLRELLGTIEQT